MLPEVIESLLVALATLPNHATRLKFLGTAYKELVGYDPFEDDPTSTIREVAALYCGVIWEAAKN